MNKTIRLYTNISETRHRKHLEIVKTLQSVQENILDLKKWLNSIKSEINVYVSITPEVNKFEIVLKTSECPVSLYFSLTQKSYEEITSNCNPYKTPMYVLDYIYKLARKEYNQIGEKYNRVSRVNIGRSKTLRW